MGLGAAIAGLGLAPAYAASLDVSPVLIDIVGPRPGATSLTLRNRGAAPANVQMRLFRWRQQDGADLLEPTRDVLVSPPLARVAPGAPYVVRVVRLSTQPVTAEESYRLLIDELPAPPSAPGGTVQLAVRYSLPVFFRAPGASIAGITWSVALESGQLKLRATNQGDRRVRITDLRVVATDGTTATVSQGLAGYALGHAAHDWRVDLPANFRLSGAQIHYGDEAGLRQIALNAPARQPS